MTGQVGEQLDVAADGSWTWPINAAEEWSVTVGRDQLRRIGRDWWWPWKTSVLACWDADDGDGPQPVFLGPITGLPDEDQDADTAKLPCRGLPALLAERVVIARDYGQNPDYPVESDMVWLARSQVALRGMSLGTIAQELVRLSTEAKLGGDLPIRYASPREQSSRLNERTYEGWNLSNNGLWKRLEELTAVRNGPDIAFRPEWVDDERTRVRWAMFHGTAAQPTIAQDWTMDLDTTAEESVVASVGLKSDVSALTQRVYWTGAGEGAGTLVRMAQNDAALEEWMPLLETVGATSDTENGALVQAHADAALAAGSQPIHQLSIEVDGSDDRARIGRWRVGDSAMVTVAGWLRIPDGTRPFKVISASGSWDSSMVTLEFQEAEQW